MHLCADSVSQPSWHKAMTTPATFESFRSGRVPVAVLIMFRTGRGVMKLPCSGRAPAPEGSNSLEQGGYRVQ